MNRDSVDPTSVVLRVPTLEGALVRVGFSTRRGGLRREGGELVVGDVAAFCDALGLARTPPVWQRQVHGSAVTRVGGADGVAPVAVPGRSGDALVTDEPGIPLAVLVADCVPILLWDPGGVVAAVHAGWRGTAADIVSAALRQVSACGGDPGAVRAAIGPHIGPCCYEVGPEVVDGLGEVLEREVFVRPGRRDRPHVDLGAANRALLRRAGVSDERIEHVGGCTCCDPSLWSYRRDGPDAGRLVAAIELR